MASKLIKTGVELDRETHGRVTEWADREGRSTRRHLAIVLRKLVTLHRTNPAALASIGLVDPASVPTPPNHPN